MSKFTESAKAQFFALDPHLWAELEGHKYYECPINGDTVPMVVVTPEGVVKYSCHYEIEDQEREFDYVHI